MTSPAAPVQPPLDDTQPRPLGRFVVSENLDLEMRALGLDTRTLALWSNCLTPDLVASVLRSRRASKRVLVALRSGLRFAAQAAGSNAADHITLRYLAERAT